ncbi:MAG: ester cyclase, partial [Chloroflexi bacterium]|nr:ester cyclase [Chloroflexota bacterium]
KGSGTHKGNAWGFPPTNEAVEFEGVTIFTLNAAGLISDRWGAFCFYDIFADLGLVPPFWELSQYLPHQEG